MNYSMGEYDLEYILRISIKAQAWANFLVKCSFHFQAAKKLKNDKNSREIEVVRRWIHSRGQMLGRLDSI